MGKVTFEDFMRTPDTKPASEWSCGEVMQKPMPNIPHSSIQMFLGFSLFGYLREHPLGRVFPELRCIFGPSNARRIYVPDLVFVSKEHLPPPSDLFLYRAPDLAVEVLSPEQHRPQFVNKIQFYLMNGVRLVWIIDPETSTIAVEEPGNEDRILGLDDVLAGGDLLPGWSISVAEIFAQMNP